LDVKPKIRQPEVATGALKLATDITTKRCSGARWGSSTGHNEKLLAQGLARLEIGKPRVRAFIPGACMKELFSTQRHGPTHTTHANKKEV
jgi:hypothetical protein